MNSACEMVLPIRQISRNFAAQALKREERVLTGSWNYSQNVLRGNEVCERIEWLVSKQLRKIATSPQWGEWETLFQDPADGRYCGRLFPCNDLNGNGPPQLREITESEARMKYRI